MTSRIDFTSRPTVCSARIADSRPAPGPFPTWMLSTGVGTGGDVDGTDWDAVGATMPRGRIGTPEDVAHAVAFLAGPHASYITGQVVRVNGGLFM